MSQNPKTTSSDPMDLSARIVQMLFFAITGLFLVLTLFGLRALSVPILIAFLLALMMNPLVDFLEGMDLRRGVATVIVFVLFVTSLALFFYFVVPIIQEQLHEILAEDKWPQIQKKTNALLSDARARFASILPSFIKIDRWNMEMFMPSVRTMMEEQMASLKDNLGVIITNLIITPIITIIFLLQGDDIYQTLIGKIPNRYFEMSVLLIHRVKHQITGYLRGLLIQWVINVAIFSIGFKLIGLEYALTMGVIAGSLNFIPYIGPVIGIMPALIVALLMPGNMVAWTLVVFSFAHIFDNVFTQPIILGAAAELHPLVAILALITCERLFGIVGMVIALPLAGILIATIEVMYRSLKAFKII